MIFVSCDHLSIFLNLVLYLLAFFTSDNYKVEMKSEDMIFSCVVLYAFLPFCLCIYKEMSVCNFSVMALSHVSILRNIPKLHSRENYVKFP
jgi:hypothetical protein